MVPNPNPVFLRLSDGKVLGVPAEGKAGTGAAMFGPGTLPERGQAAVNAGPAEAAGDHREAPARRRQPTADHGEADATGPRPEPPATGTTDHRHDKTLHERRQPAHQ